MESASVIPPDRPVTEGSTSQLRAFHGSYPILLGPVVILEIYASYPIGLEAGLRAIPGVLFIGLVVTLLSARLVGRDRCAAIAATRDARQGDATSVALVAAQTRCVDSLLAKAVHDIVTARPGAVVIVLSDHGPEERIDWWEPAEPGIRDRVSNLFWARTPGRSGVLPDDISLVNVFARLFNAYFETDLPMHPNDRYLGPSNVSPAVLPYAPSMP